LSARHLFALVALSLWVGGGCASILGVDASDYADAAAIMCFCTAPGKETECAEEVESAIAKSEELEQIALDCIGETEGDCTAIAACVKDSDYCTETPGQSCLKGKGGSEILACCAANGLECGDDNKCCAADGAPCPATGRCCVGTSCVAGACDACTDRVCDVDEECCEGFKCRLSACVGPK